jgi:hypothetical protein
MSCIGGAGAGRSFSLSFSFFAAAPRLRLLDEADVSLSVLSL